MPKKDQINVLALTGAGISAESGISTFRDSGGLWENHRIEDVATPEAFRKDPELVWEFYKQRYLQAIEKDPNAGHSSLVELEKRLGNRFHVITQNVDGLHQKAGQKNIYEMHGSLFSSFCTNCHKKHPTKELDFSIKVPKCKVCGNSLRPDIVWFGEIPYCLYEIEHLLKDCDVFIIIGTSGVVYPAAGFVMTAKYFGAHTIAVNLERPGNSAIIDEFHLGKAGEILPALLKQWS